MRDNSNDRDAENELNDDNKLISSMRVDAREDNDELAEAMVGDKSSDEPRAKKEAEDELDAEDGENKEQNEWSSLKTKTRDAEEKSDQEPKEFVE